MAIVESVRVHLHEQRQQMQREEDLSCPRPIPHKRPAAPEQQPDRLVYTLHHHPTATPFQPTFTPLEDQMQRQTQRRSSAHKRIAHSQLVDILREQRPLADVQDGASLFEVSQGSRERHDGQADPEEDEEAGEVGILARGIEVGDARLVFDGREYAAAALLAELFAYGGGGFD